MVPFARRSLLHDRARFAISVGGVAFAILLILVLRGIFEGTINKATIYTERVGADLFVTQAGVDHMAMAAPVIPLALEDVLAQLPEVETAAAVVRLPAIAHVSGADISVSIVGFNPEIGLGGPWQIDEGTAKLELDGAIIDRTLASQRDIELGDVIEVGGGTYRVQGFAGGSNALAVGRVVWVHRDTAAERFLPPESASFVLLKLTAGADLEAVRSTITAVTTELAVLTRDELIESDRALFRTLFGVPVNVMAAIGFIVGLLVIGLATYSAAAERTRDFGVLKAVGARNTYLYRTVLQIALAITTGGFFVGLLLAFAIGPVIERITPEIGVSVRPSFALQTLMIALGLSLIASLVPVRRIAGLDPKRVFSQ